MSDKLQKTDSTIVPASKIADKIASALKDDKPASTARKCTHPMHGIAVENRTLCGKYFIIPKASYCHPDCLCCAGEILQAALESISYAAGYTIGRQQAKIANFGEMAERNGASPKTLVSTDFEAAELRAFAKSVFGVTLPTESSMKNFDVKVVGEDGQPVRLIEFEPEVEMPDLRVGCGAEFPTIVNRKTLRCKKWRGHEGDHSDKLDGVSIKWANK